MKIPTNNYKKKTIIFNNRFLKSIKSDFESFHKSDAHPLPDAPDVQNISPPSNPTNSSDDEIEINITLENGENIKKNFYLNKNIYNEVENFCKKYKISEEGEDLILEQIDSKIAELMEQNEKNVLKNKKNEIENKNSNIINNNKMTGDEIGQKLYEKGMKFKLKKQLTIQLMREKLEPKYDFRPHLSKKTLELTKNLYNKKIKIEDRLLSLGNEQQKKRLKLIAEKKMLEEKENIPISRSRSKNKSNKKYNSRSNKIENALMKNKEKNEKEYSGNFYPFKPKITKMSENMKKETHNNIINKDNNRIKINNQEQNNNNIKNISAKINLQKNKNPKNIINKKNKKINNIKRKQINYCLYSLEDSKNNFDEGDIKEQGEKNFEINAKNKLRQIKEYKFREIFDLLDNNKKGYLSYSNINFINIDQNILDAISPVIGQINENKNKKIYFNEFKKLVNKPLTDVMLN